MTDSNCKWIWNSDQAAKADFHKWHMHFVMKLSSVGIEFVLSKTDTELHRPLSPGQAPDPITFPKKYDTWFTNSEKHREASARLQDAFTKAIGFIRATLPYPSMASSRIEGAMLNPNDDDDDISWVQKTGSVRLTNLSSKSFLQMTRPMYLPYVVIFRILLI